MPKLDLTIPKGVLSESAKESLAKDMAASLLRWEGLPESEFFRTISWVHVHELDPGAVFTADGAGAEPHAVVDVTVLADAFTDEQRAGVIEELTEMVLEATGWGEEARLRVWVLIAEVPDGSWGSGGHVVRFEQLKAAADAERAAAPANGAKA
jgi:phenylpyruvate tautomerase PptA (4-oxalocrotonate tautomerase family)